MKNYFVSKKNIILFLIIFFLCPNVFECRAELLPVQFAGFAFMGNSCQIEENYPFVYSVSKETLTNGQGLLDKELHDRIKNIPLKNAYFMKKETLQQLDDGSLTLACCLDNESITVEKYEKCYKIVINLGAQLLLFDYSSRKLVACYPFGIELIDNFKTKPSDKIIKKRIRELLLTNKYQMNLFDECAKVLRNIKLQKFYGGKIQVTEVKIEERAIPFLPKKFSNDVTNFQNFVAQSFGKFLSKNQSVPILPYTKCYAIVKKMALRFSDATVVHLDIPEPNFGVKLTVRGFKKVQTDKKVAGSCWVYGSFVRMVISQPLLGKNYMDEKVKNGLVKLVPALQKTVDDWPVYQESLMVLFDKITKNFAKKSKYKKVMEVCKRCQ